VIPLVDLVSTVMPMVVILVMLQDSYTELLVLNTVHLDTSLLLIQKDLVNHVTLPVKNVMVMLIIIVLIVMIIISC
jgi:hypothetical protein